MASPWWGWIDFTEVSAYTIWVWRPKPTFLWELRRGGNAIQFPRWNSYKNIQKFMPVHHMGLVSKLGRDGNGPFVEMWQEAEPTFRWDGTEYTKVYIKPQFISFIKSRIAETNVWVRDRILYEGGAISKHFQKLLENK